MTNLEMFLQSIKDQQSSENFEELDFEVRDAEDENGQEVAFLNDDVTFCFDNDGRFLGIINYR